MYSPSIATVRTGTAGPNSRTDAKTKTSDTETVAGRPGIWIVKRLPPMVSAASSSAYQLSSGACSDSTLCAMMAAPLATIAARKARSGTVVTRAAASVRTARLPPQRLPFGGEDRPHDLIAVDGAVAEAAPQHAVAGRAEPLEHTIAADIDVDRSRFEAIHPEV